MINRVVCRETTSPKAQRKLFSREAGKEPEILLSVRAASWK